MRSHFGVVVLRGAAFECLLRVKYQCSSISFSGRLVCASAYEAASWSLTEFFGRLLVQSQQSVGPYGDAIGFIGLGVMGEPMCRNLATKSGRSVFGFDRSAEPLARLKSAGVVPTKTISELTQHCSVVFLALPSGQHVDAVCQGDDGLLTHARSGTLVVDCGTSPVDLTRALAARFAARDVRFADAPIARTRQAAEAGTLSIMVGADDDVFKTLAPLLAHMASDVTHCGGVGCGQITKIMNNMVLIQTVVALSEAAAVARHAGLDPQILFETLAKGSADSFALRNHGLKAIIPEAFPERAFSTAYAHKDLSYARQLAHALGLQLAGAETANVLLEDAMAAGFSDLYWPVISRMIDRPATVPALAVDE
jgi:3-hydroxyisobutyrate dehydrogenase-like beta-hydroxyacid dehydrogenase